VPDPCIVVIASSDLLSSITRRTGASDGEVLTFTDAEPLRALAAITKRRPTLVALERLFAMTPRGAALISRIKADPKLDGAEIRVLAHDSDYARTVPRPVARPPALDQRGTRRAPRFKMKSSAIAGLDGMTVRIADLSPVGAQIVSAKMLKPHQVVAMTLSDGAGEMRFSATVVWTSFEIPHNSGPRYRAGINFVDANPVDVDAFCTRHQA
jgi:hypothetical protein